VMVRFLAIDVTPAKAGVNLPAVDAGRDISEMDPRVRGDDEGRGE
jgi:hypothetical protein